MQIIYPSMVSNLSERVYRAEPALSQTLIRNYATSPTPWHFYRQHLGSHGYTVTTPAMILGSITHARLELKTKGAFEEKYTKMPKGMRKDSKPAKDFQLANNGKIAVGAGDWDLSYELFKSVQKNKTAMSFLNDGVAEESFFDVRNGQKIKGRFDLRAPTYSILADWKTCFSANPITKDGFKKSVLMSRLDWQAAFYKEAAETFFPEQTYDFVFICIEKTYPFACSLITLSQADMRRAHEQVFEAFDEVIQRIKNNDWGDGYGSRIWTMQLGNINAK